MGINNRDEIVGVWIDSHNVHHGFILSEGRFRTIDLPGATFTNAQGINDRGEIVGRADVGGAVHGYLFSDGNFVLIRFSRGQFCYRSWH